MFSAFEYDGWNARGASAVSAGSPKSAERDGAVAERRSREQRLAEVPLALQARRVHRGRRRWWILGVRARGGSRGRTAVSGTRTRGVRAKTARSWDIWLGVRGVWVRGECGGQHGEREADAGRGWATMVVCAGCKRSHGERREGGIKQCGKELAGRGRGPKWCPCLRW